MAFPTASVLSWLIGIALWCCEWAVHATRCFRESRRRRRLARACRSLPTFLTIPPGLADAPTRLAIAMSLAEAGAEFDRRIAQVAAAGTYRLKPEKECRCAMCQMQKAVEARDAALFGLEKTS